MTNDTARLPDLIVRTTCVGSRFGWRLLTLDGNRFLTSMEQSAKDGSPPDYASRTEARQAAGQMLLKLVEEQPAISSGEVIDVQYLKTPSRLVA